MLNNKNNESITIDDILKNVSYTNAIQYKNLANSLIDLYGNDKKHKKKKLKLVSEVAIVEQYLAHFSCEYGSCLN